MVIKTLCIISPTVWLIFSHSHILWKFMYSWNRWRCYEDKSVATPKEFTAILHVCRARTCTGLHSHAKWIARITQIHRKTASVEPPHRWTQVQSGKQRERERGNKWWSRTWTSNNKQSIKSAGGRVGEEGGGKADIGEVGGERNDGSLFKACWPHGRRLPQCRDE